MCARLAWKPVTDLIRGGACQTRQQCEHWRNQAGTDVFITDAGVFGTVFLLLLGSTQSLFARPTLSQE